MTYKLTGKVEGQVEGSTLDVERFVASKLDRMGVEVFWGRNNEYGLVHEGWKCVGRVDLVQS